DAIAGGGGSGELPLATAEGEEHVPNPIPELAQARPDFAGMRINGLKPFSHFGQSFLAAHPGARPQKLAATAAVFPPKGDPVPASTGLAFLQTAALKTTAPGSDGFRNRDHVAHGWRL